MRMRRDYQIALLLGLASNPAGVALMAAPEHFPALKEYSGQFFWGGAMRGAGAVKRALMIG
jgi:hypothetical protein